MKKILLISVSLIFSLSLMAKDKPSLFYRSLEFSFVAGQIGDTFTTYKCLETGNGIERNSIVRSYLNNKPLTIAITTVSAYVVLKLMRTIRKKNRPIASISLAVLSIAVWCVVGNNTVVLRRLRG